MKVRSGQVGSGQVRSGQVRSGQVGSGMLPFHAPLIGAGDKIITELA